jgi:hypothetical protein
MSNTKGSVAGKSERGEKQPKPRAPRRENAVDRAITAFEKTLESNKNVSVGDYVRLLQLQKEIDGDEPKDIECTWVEQDETKSSEK